MNFKNLLLSAVIFLVYTGSSEAQVTYKLDYDMVTEVYTVSITSQTAYSGPFARISASTLITIVAPHTAGGFQVTDLMNLQPGSPQLSWGFSRLDAPSENPTKDYLFFGANNAGSYGVFNIPANTELDLFSFKSGSGCIGALALFENDADPLNTNPTLNPNNNFVILGAGLGNQYLENASGNVFCACNAGTTAPNLSAGTASNLCPDTTVDLDALLTDTVPTGATLVWSTDSDASDGLASIETSPTSTAGTYYAYFSDTLNQCFSPASMSVVATVMACNEAPEIISTDSVGFSENGVGTVVDAVSTDDSDSENNGLTYSLTGNAPDDAEFNIDPVTGVITFVNPPDFENPTDDNMDNDYEIEVEVCDSENLCTTQSITVTVTDATENGAPVITNFSSNPTANTTYQENASTVIENYEATDPDSETENGGGLLWSISGGADQAALTIDPATGDLTFNVPPDFELPTDVGADNTYEVEVTVTDAAGLTDVQLLTITIIDNPSEAPCTAGNVAPFFKLN